MRPPSPAAPLAALLACAALAACGHVRPEAPTEAALYEDARRIVQTASATGWIIDRVEIDRLGPTLMQSTCQVSAERREALLRWLDLRILALGGPAAEAYLREGRDKSAVSDILEMERVRDLVAWGHTHSEADCPFWLEPSDGFDGVQGDYDRLVLVLETRGLASINISGGDVGVGGGGGGRVLLGYGTSHELTLLFGGEVGGAGIFQPDPETGERTLKGTVVGAVPFVFRFNDGGRVWDVETALAGIWRESDERLDLGARVAFGTGVATPRVGAFKPMVMLWVLYEFFPPQGGGPANHFIGIGTRIGVNIDP